MTAAGNILDPIPENLKNELVETIVRAAHVRIERIVSLGHCSPAGFWYDQDEHEWVIILKGSARLRFEDKREAIKMVPGSYINIEKHQRHRVEWTAPGEETVWLAVYYS